MKSSFVSLALAALLFGCSGTPTPVATSTPAAPANNPSVEAEAATPTPAPVASGPTDNSSLTQTINLIDSQVGDNILTSKEVTDGDTKLTVWSGGEGIRRIDFESPTEKGHSYYQGGRVISFGATSQAKEGDKVSYWSGFGPEDHLIGPPYRRINGELKSLPDDDARALAARGQKWHSLASGE